MEISGGGGILSISSCPATGANQWAILLSSSVGHSGSAKNISGKETKMNRRLIWNAVQMLMYFAFVFVLFLYGGKKLLTEKTINGPAIFIFLGCAVLGAFYLREFVRLAIAPNTDDVKIPPPWCSRTWTKTDRCYWFCVAVAHNRRLKFILDICPHCDQRRGRVE